VNPIISPDPGITFDCPMRKATVAWEANDTFNPAATVRNGKICVLYRSEDRSGVGIGERTSRIGIAESTDGIHFKRSGKPVLFPAEDAQKENEWPGGCEDPRVTVTKDGTYVMMYTQWNRKIARLAVATSKDLTHWLKSGPAFQRAFGGKFAGTWSKSGSVLTELDHGHLVMAKVHGHYWMYWGEGTIYGATSDNLTDWTPFVDDRRELVPIVKTRKGYFDSDLAECGPPAVKTDRGILLLYNGKNASNDSRDPRYPSAAYCAGQVLFDAERPEVIKERLDTPFLRPMAPFEKSGQYRSGTVFIEGLTYFHAKWWLYYGCADSRVAVAEFDPRKPTPPDPMP